MCELEKYTIARIQTKGKAMKLSKILFEGV